MGLRARMAIVVGLLFGLMFAVLMGVAYYFDLGVYIALLFTVLVVLLQWGLSPLMVRWIYHINWVEPEALGRRVADYLRRTCEERSIKFPTIGIIEDNNPNAFTFGWTRNSAYLVVTRGVLNYCKEDEVKAVVGHELGHIANNDFVLMTVISSIPLIMYVVYRFGLRMLRGGGKGKAAAAVAGVVVVSYIVYLLSQFLVLLVSRLREYYADSFSAKTTGNPNALSRALVTIAYGLAVEGRGKPEVQRKLENGLMFFNPTAARALAANATGEYGEVRISAVKKAMSWDLWNPWAFFLELKMTHPLPAKRIKALADMSEEAGQVPYVKFDLKQPESYWDDFLGDIFALYSPLLSIPFAVLLFLYFYPVMGLFALFAALGGLLLVAGLLGYAYLAFYHYPTDFEPATVEDLVGDPKAGPIRGRPVTLTGKIIGRGRPGLFWSEDLKLQDSTGLILLDYHQVLKLIDFLVGVFATAEKVGKEVVVEGWYRRMVVPYIELYKVHFKDRQEKLYTAGLKKAGAAVAAVIGAVILFLTWGML